MQLEAWSYIRDELCPDLIFAQEAGGNALPDWLREE